MELGKNLKLWILWVVLTITLAIWLGLILNANGSQDMLMPGPLSAGHRQFDGNCTICHTEPLGGSDVLQQTCIDCHGDVRQKPFDSHPAAKFEDPRNAERLEAIDVRQCTSCHVEHQPRITLRDGLTQPRDVCFHCHDEIGEDRPSHANFKFDTCKDSGCHNFHDNRALYTDFLIKHLDDPPTRAGSTVPSREFAELLDELIEYPRDRYPLTELGPEDVDSPSRIEIQPEIIDAWSSSAHARSGVNCSACHDTAEATDASETWTDNPDEAMCAQCHGPEVARFKRGKHGMRRGVGMTPLRVANASLAMSDEAHQRLVTCSSCHDAHAIDTRRAAVEACLGCHADKHSLAYKQSPHYQLWQHEVDGTGPAGSGVSCATCHMPRIDYDVNDWMSRKLVEHNQSAVLSPNSKMVRPACLHCHGLEFALNSLADPNLIDENFATAPQVVLETMTMARLDHERALREIEGLSD